jgi:hypothetical protein
MSWCGGSWVLVRESWGTELDDGGSLETTLYNSIDHIVGDGPQWYCNL